MRGGRPFGVIAIAILQLVNAALALRPVPLSEPGIERFIAQAADFEVAGALLGLFGVAAAIGLLLLRTWGWTAAMLWAGGNLAIELVAYAEGEPEYLAMVVSLAAVFYLNQRDVQSAFGLAGAAQGPGVERS